MENKKNKNNNSSNSLVFGRWPQTKTVKKLLTFLYLGRDGGGTFGREISS